MAGSQSFSASLKQTDDSDDGFFVPLQDQRIFGAGVKRKRIQFVRATDAEPAGDSCASTFKPSPSISDRYLSIVHKDDSKRAVEDRSGNDLQSEGPLSVSDRGRCQVCFGPLEEDADSVRWPDDGSALEQGTLRQPAGTAHEKSLAHQVCLQHVRPPSHLDRKRQGFRYLSSYGWDPDASHGLGPHGEGIQAPIKQRLKNNTVGLGADSRQPETDAASRATDPRSQARSQAGSKENQARLDAKGTRKLRAEEDRKTAGLRNMIWGDDRLEQYLGQGASSIS